MTLTHFPFCTQGLQAFWCDVGQRRVPLHARCTGEGSRGYDRRSVCRYVVRILGAAAANQPRGQSADDIVSGGLPTWKIWKSQGFL